MAQHVVKTTLTRGELNPLMHARSDVEFYAHGAETLTNWLVLKEGGVRRRPGTVYRGAAKYDDKDTRFVDFKYSAAQAFAIEMGDVYARFWRGTSQIMSGMSPYEIVSPYDEDAIRELNWVQSGDTLYIAHKSMTIKPKKLIRKSDTSWAFSDVVFRDGPYIAINDQQNAVTLSASAVTGATSVLTFANTANINDGLGFVATDVGRLIRVQIAGKYSWGHITVRSSDKIVTVLWEDGQGGGVGGAGSLTWRLGAFSDTTGYPGAVAIFQGRVFWGNTPSNSRYLGYSYSGLPETFSPSDIDATVTDANGGYLDILAGDDILWMQEAPRLQLGTPSAIRSVGASDIDTSFGPRNNQQKLEVPEGASSVRPVVIGPSTVHCSAFSKSIHDLRFDFESNTLVNPELTNLSYHLTEDGVREVWFQQLPFRRMWSVLENGKLASTTVDKYEKVIGFSSHDVGGTVITACAIPGSAQTDLWMVVRREIDGVQKQYVEALAPDFVRKAVETAYFVDCGGTYSGVATNTVTGITWLANTEVDILADGRVVPRQTISGAGVLTLPGGLEAETISYGLPIEARGKVLRAPVQLPNGGSLGRKMRVANVDVDVYETQGLKLISNRGQEDRLLERPSSSQQISVYGLSTGTWRSLVDGSWTSEGQFSFVMDTPLPATIRAFNILLDTET